MLWQWSPSVIAELAAAVVILVMAIYFPWRELNRRASLIGVTLLLVCAMWVLSHAVEIGIPVPSFKSYLMGAQLIWGTLAITFWLLYIVTYCGPRKWLTKRTYVLLCVMPFIIILGVWTNRIHNLIWSKPGLDSHNPYLPLQPTYGIIYWICMVYVVGLTLSGSFRLIWSVVRLHHGRSRESASLLIAAVLPMLAAVVETLGLSNSLKLSIGITPWASFIGTIIIVWNLPRLHLREVIPFARDTLFERIEDYIIVLDKWNRVMDLNPAAERFVGHKVSDVLGFSVKEIIPQWPDQIGVTDPEIEPHKEIILERGGEQRTYNLSVSTAFNPDGQPTSRVILLADISYRKKVEEELKKAKIRLDLAIEASQIGIWELDLLKDTSVRNIRHDQIFGYTEELAEWGVKKIFEHIISEDRPSVQAAFNEATKTDRLYFKCRIVWPDKSIHWITATGKAIRDRDGKPQKMFGTITDITERQQIEEGLAREQSLLNALMDNIPDQVYFKDAASRFIRISKAQSERFGLSDPAQAVSKTDFDFFAKDHAQPAFEDEQKIMRTGQSLEDLEEKEIWSDGRTGWVSTTKVPLRDKQGRIVGTIGISRDITERKQAEEALSNKQRMLVRTEGITHVGSWEWDIARDKVTWSDELFRIFQRDPREGAPSFAEHPAFYHPDDMARLRQAVEAAVADGIPYELELRAIRKDGETRICVARGVAEMAPGEQAVSLFGSLQDITERKQAEDIIKASLQEKEVMLREIHHRVKNNMQVISSLFNLQAGHTQSREYREILKGGQTRIQAMSLVHEKLYQSRALSKINLATYVQSLAVLLFQSYRMDFNQVRLETDYEDVPLDINSAVPCGLILNELISNSLKHAFPEGRKGKIRIGLKRSPDDTIIIRVADDGIGFSKKFDFRRSESLGLQIANLLVGQLDGTIELDRENGTAFTVTFRELKYAPRI